MWPSSNVLHPIMVHVYVSSLFEFGLTDWEQNLFNVIVVCSLQHNYCPLESDLACLKFISLKLNHQKMLSAIELLLKLTLWFWKTCWKCNIQTMRFQPLAKVNKNVSRQLKRWEAWNRLKLFCILYLLLCMNWVGMLSSFPVSSVCSWWLECRWWSCSSIILCWFSVMIWLLSIKSRNCFSIDSLFLCKTSVTWLTDCWLSVFCWCSNCFWSSVILASFCSRKYRKKRSN